MHLVQLKIKNLYCVTCNVSYLPISVSVCWATWVSKLHHWLLM